MIFFIDAVIERIYRGLLGFCGFTLLIGREITRFNTVLLVLYLPRVQVNGAGLCGFMVE